jgi:hypothetical protein
MPDDAANEEIPGVITVCVALVAIAAVSTRS